MIHEEPARVTPVPQGKNGSSRRPISGRCRVALEHLHRAYHAPRPLAILAGHWAAESTYIANNFLAHIEHDVPVLRIGKACREPLQGMREIIRATGIEPNNMSLDELESMFMKFLSFQRARQRRTILVIEESPTNGHWVRGKVRHLMAQEAEEKFGLMVILFRQCGRRAKTNGHVVDEEARQATIDQEPKVLRMTPLVQPSGAEVGSVSIAQDPHARHNNSEPLKLILTHNGKTLREVLMDKPRLMIGSAEDNDICIKDKSVCRYHALLIRFGDTAFVKDLNSENGTYVNMERIQDQMVIHQDILSIGNHRIKFIAPSGRSG